MGFFSDPKIWKKYWIKKLWHFLCIKSLIASRRSTKILLTRGEPWLPSKSSPGECDFVRYPGVICLAARWSGQICNGHFFRFHGICWIHFASLGEASWFEYLRQLCFHDRSRRCNVPLRFEFREKRRVGKRVHVIWRLAIELHNLFSRMEGGF